MLEDTKPFGNASAACRVSHVMTADPLVVRPGTNIEATARDLLQKKVRRLPVVDDTGRLIGISPEVTLSKQLSGHAKLHSRRAWPRNEPWWLFSCRDHLNMTSPADVLR